MVVGTGVVVGEVVVAAGVLSGLAVTVAVTVCVTGSVTVTVEVVVLVAVTVDTWLTVVVETIFSGEPQAVSTATMDRETRKKALVKRLEYLFM